ncbi:bis(5'-nucleosyl)-tetraphosphatase (symmetrical) YqeK [Candidatus Saganbacteria bacterium]|nr:bis(5'-nucleosyl)-tetraphosphatase (symmetrical) YqeK [Candidatus Saganbacteria bacterium]
MKKDDRKRLGVQLKKWLPKDRFNHSLRVEKEAIKLAKHYKVSLDQASIAALLHDCGKYIEAGHMHARLGAVLAKEVFGIHDHNILNAIAKHTVGSENMTILEKILYLADHIESGRRFNGVEKIRAMAYKNMDKAIIMSTSMMIGSLLESGYPISEQTIRTRNYYIMGGKKGTNAK